jgi:hypothetical protein
MLEQPARSMIARIAKDVFIADLIESELLLRSLRKSIAWTRLLQLSFGPIPERMRVQFEIRFAK